MSKEMIGGNHWVNNEIEALRQFLRFWQEGQFDKPELFPDIMPSGEWEEQFAFFKEHKYPS